MPPPEPFLIFIRKFSELGIPYMVKLLAIIDEQGLAHEWQAALAFTD